MQNLQLNLGSELEHGSDLVIREGEALPVYPPERVALIGDIHTPANYMKVRYANDMQVVNGAQEVDVRKMIVTVDKKGGVITLLLNPEDRFGTVIAGKLDLSDELYPWSINQTKTFNKEELVKLIKFRRLQFDDSGKFTDLLQSFQRLTSSVNISANDGSDTRGNKERDFVKQVTTNVPTEFILNIPIFKGFPAQRFRVEICLDVTEGSARFWFESTELNDMLIAQKETIFEEVLKSCAGFVVINT